MEAEEEREHLSAIVEVLNERSGLPEAARTPSP